MELEGTILDQSRIMIAECRDKLLLKNHAKGLLAC